jgi:hypothetical protein
MVTTDTLMNSQDIQNLVEQWAKSKDFSAPYGVLTGSHTNRKGTKYLAVTFGRARTLDATVEIYNRNFMVVRTSRHGTQTFKTVAEMQQFLETL